MPAVRVLFGCGSLFVLYMLALYLALGLATGRRQVLEVGLMNYLWPAFTLLLAPVVLKKKAGLILIPGTLLALAGVFLVLTSGHSVSFTSLGGNAAANPWPYLLGVVAAVSWALFSNLTRLWAAPENSGAMVLFLPATGVILLILSLATPEESSWTGRAVLEILFLGGATALSYVLWDVAMRKGDLVFVAACSYFTPLLSTLLSCLYLRVSAGFTLWLGCLLLVAGSLLSWVGVSERSSSPLSGQPPEPERSR
jgi:drug/metabolite transporter (DMT)-like permease